MLGHRLDAKKELCHFGRKTMQHGRHLWSPACIIRSIRPFWCVRQASECCQTWTAEPPVSSSIARTQGDLAQILAMVLILSALSQPALQYMSLTRPSSLELPCHPDHPTHVMMGMSAIMSSCKLLLEWGSNPPAFTEDHCREMTSYSSLPDIGQPSLHPWQNHGDHEMLQRHACVSQGSEPSSCLQETVHYALTQSW